tara:strand:- start:1134 stop:1472 length:339 start_codon:yes stop_codon:yes gene_type:complete
MANSYNSTQAYKIARHFQYKNGVNVESITSAKTLLYSDSMFQIINSGGAGANDINLPSPKNGAFFAITAVAASTQNLVVKDHDGATITTLASSGEGCIVVCDGDDWYGVIKG